MTPRRTAADRLADILIEAEFALQFVAGLTRDALARDPLVTRAVLYCLTIIGEAAGHLPEDVRAREPGVPWRQVVGMRNRLVHDYIRTDHGIVWDTVAHNLPILVAAVRRLRAALAEPPPAPEAPNA